MISIHALLAESDMQIVIVVVHALISIHALLAESDLCRKFEKQDTRISIHALLAESDPIKPLKIGKNLTFLSTLSLRRATNLPLVMIPSSLYFYPRSPCGERPEKSK